MNLIRGIMAKKYQPLIDLWISKQKPIPYIETMVHPYTDKTSNGLARMIVDWMNLCNTSFGTRMSVEGRVIEGKKFTDVLGNKKQMASKRIPSSNLPGSFDVTCCSFSVRLEVEIKIGRDVIRPDQLKFKDRIETAGGAAIIVTSWEDFYSQWKLFILDLPRRLRLMADKADQFVEELNKV